jgi:hypothetical protein
MKDRYCCRSGKLHICKFDLQRTANSHIVVANWVSLKVLRCARKVRAEVNSPGRPTSSLYSLDSVPPFIYFHTYIVIDIDRF